MINKKLEDLKNHIELLRIFESGEPLELDMISAFQYVQNVLEDFDARLSNLEQRTQGPINGRKC